MTEHPNDNDGNPIKGYAKTIFEATGITDRNFLCEIEETMRHDIFHSTLDWQTREQLQDAAKQAYNLITGAPSPKSSVNPPAFPCEAISDRNVPPEKDHIPVGTRLSRFPGMTLRDYFAAAALTGIVTKTPYNDPERHARIAYKLADAMLRERA